MCLNLLILFLERRNNFPVISMNFSKVKKIGSAVYCQFQPLYAVGIY